MSESNPFLNIRTELRSEEDDIRRGIFNRALRNLAQSTAEQKFSWCAAIDEKSTGNRTRAPADAPKGPEESSPMIVEPGQKRDRESSPTEEKPYMHSESEANRYIGAYLHSQIEKAIGTTLRSCGGNALRILCTILDISTKTRSTETLYNTLASYHYTHCEVLGKRVSRNTFVERQALEDSESFQRLIKTSKAKPTTNAPKSAATADSGKEAAKPSRTTEASSWISKRPLVAGAVGSSRALPLPMMTGKPVVSHSSHGASDNSSELVIAYPEPTFANDRTASRITSSTSGAAEEWTPQRLEKAIATIVRNYDPVTTTIVVKKLNKIGYADPHAESIVDSFLVSFHQKKYIHYENGIAYCLD